MTDSLSTGSFLCTIFTDTWIYLDDFGINMMLVKAETHSGMSGCGVYESKEDILKDLHQGMEDAVMELS